MDKGLGLSEFLDYIGALTSTSRSLVEGEEVLNAGHIIMCGRTNTGPSFVEICSLCLQSSALNSEPHKIEGSFIIRSGKVKIEKMVCSCKAGAGGRCKHITAVLIKLTREDLMSLEQVSRTDLKCIWNQQKAEVKNKYRPLPTDDMPCIKDKIKVELYDIDEEEMRNEYMDILPDSAIGKHRKGRDTHLRVKKNQSNFNDPLNVQILDNCAQSIEMLELSSVEINFQFDCCKNTFINLFNEDQGLAINLQQNSVDWHTYRKFRITGSRCYDIYTYKGKDWKTKASKYFWPKTLSNKYLEHGKMHEKNAIDAFMEKTRLKVHRCGLVIPHNNEWMSFSPDGIIFDKEPIALLEIKCLYAGASCTIREALTSCKFIHTENAEYTLKKRHKYYGQIQMGMAILNLKQTYLILYASHDKSMEIIKIQADNTFIKEMLTTLKMNYIENMIHVICENNL